MTPYETTALGKIDRTLFGSTDVRRTMMALGVAALLILIIQFVHKSTQTKTGYRELLHGGEAVSEDGEALVRTRGAFGRWMYDIQAAERTGGDVYRDYWFPTPPLVLALLRPFALLPVAVGAAVWAFLKAGCVVLAAWLVFGAIGRADRALPFGVGLMAVAFGARPIVSDMQHGNINIFILALLAATLYLWAERRDGWAGTALGAAIAMKVTPGLVALYFLYRRQWRVAGAAVLGTVLFAGVLPTIAFGVAKTVDHYRGWYAVMVEPAVVEGWVTTDIDNQSLAGVLLRWLGATRATGIEAISPEQAQRYGAIDLARPTAAWARAVLRVVPWVGLVALGVLCRTRWTERRDPRVWLEVALVLLAMLLLGERTWKHHAVTFLIIYAAMWYGLACFAWSVRFRFVFAVGLGVQLVLLGLTGEDLLGDAVSDGLLFGGAFCAGMVLAFAQAAWLLRRAWGEMQNSE
jgi:hypothetical protein